MHLSSLRAETLFCALGVPCLKQTRHEHDTVYTAEYILCEVTVTSVCAWTTTRTEVHTENGPKKSGHVLRCDLSLGSRVECNCNF